MPPTGALGVYQYSTFYIFRRSTESTALRFFLVRAKSADGEISNKIIFNPDIFILRIFKILRFLYVRIYVPGVQSRWLVLGNKYRDKKIYNNFT